MFHRRKEMVALLLCGMLMASLLVVPTYAGESHDHDGVVALAGSRVQECTNSSGHKFVQVEETDPASVGYTPECPNATVYQLKCAYCSAERGYYGGKHEWSGWTDHGDGTRSHACTLCGKEETETVGQTGHTHTLVTVTTPATCTQDGSTYEKCTKCDYVGPKTAIPATGHDPVEDDDCRTPPHCAVCGELLWDGKTYPAIHNFSGPYEYDASGHWQHCQNPGCNAVSEVSRHRTTGGVSDCTKGEVCTECGATVAMGRGHNFENAKVGITTAAGHYLICANPGCGQTQFFAHSFSAGKCTVCGAADPNYKPAQGPEPQAGPSSPEPQAGPSNPEPQAGPSSPEPQAGPSTPAPQAPQVTQKEPEAQETPKAQEAPAAQETPKAQEGPAAPETPVVQAPQGNVADVAVKFSDVAAGKWYTKDIQRVVDAGLMSGVSDTSFQPNANVNRAMVVTLLYRLAGQPAAAEASFTDVKATAYYAKAVAWGSENGVVSGFKDRTFKPNQEITRQDLATFLYRYAKQAGYTVVSTGDLTVFADRDEIAPWAYEAMAWANQVGLVNGRSGNLLAPTAPTTRAEVASVLVRLMDLMAQ